VFSKTSTTGYCIRSSSHKVKFNDTLVALAANSFKDLVLTQSELVKGVTNEMMKDLKKSFVSGAS